MTDEVLTERRGAVMVITMNRPRVRNAVDGAMARGVAAALDELDRDDGLAVGVLTGAGGTFCAGTDLAAFLAGDLPVVRGRGLAGITQAPPDKPVVAAVEGYALAGGCEIEALGAALALAGRIGANGPLAVRATARILREGADWPADERWARQEQLLRPVPASADAREGATAFAEERAPVRQGA